MSVDQVDNNYYTPVQSTTSYSDLASSAPATSSSDGTSAASNGNATRRDTEPRREEQKVYLYLSDQTLGQNVNLLV